MLTLRDKSPSLSVAIPVGILLLGAVLRLHELGRALGGADENAMLLYFGYSPFQYIAKTYYDANNHIFHTLLVHLMTVLFGEDNAIAIRFPTFVFGLACLWLIYLVARELFHSRSIAWFSMLIAAIHPVHIHYSQTARGYSLIMFFSIAIVYASLRLLKTRENVRWGSVLVVCGFLSVYTLPTNAYFLLGFGAWLFFILLVPRWAGEYNLQPQQRRGKTRLLLGLGVLTGLLCALAYLPVYDQMIETAQQHPLLTFDSAAVSVMNLIPAILQRIFQGPLVILVPFLIAGILFGNTVRASDRLLPLFVFFLPLSIPLFSGIGGYPRNYLFNFPLMVIFVAAGVAWAGRWAARRLHMEKKEKILFACFAAVTSMISLKVTLLDYYPSIRIADGMLYKQEVRKHSSPEDLLLIANPEHYLYARSVYKDNLRNIISGNKMTGIKLIVPDAFDLDSYSLPTGGSPLEIFKNLFKKEGLKTRDVSGGKKILALPGSRTIAALTKDFEINSDWEIISGKGEWAKEPNHKITGKGSLLVRASPEQDMMVRTALPNKITIEKLSLIVMVWAQKNLSNQGIVYSPALSSTIQFGEHTRRVQFLMGKINNGINYHMQESGRNFNSYHWVVNTILGKIPPGTYDFDLVLLCDPGGSVLYDSLRLFFIELPDDALQQIQ